MDTMAPCIHRQAGEETALQIHLRIGISSSNVIFWRPHGVLVDAFAASRLTLTQIWEFILQTSVMH